VAVDHEGEVLGAGISGETIRTEMWRNAGGVTAFRSRVVERDVVVLDQGVAMVRD
jgi:hypothetical protein